jgi:hypothetical protein
MKNYYHFVCEGLVRLLLTLQYLESRPDINVATLTWLFPAGLGYTKPFLKLLGLSHLKLYEYGGGPDRLSVPMLYVFDWQADEIVPALAEHNIPTDSDADGLDDAAWDISAWPDYAALPAIETGRELAHDPWSQFYPPQAGLLLLRDRIRAALAPTLSPEWQLLYLSRHDSLSGDFGIRVVRNEEVLIDGLRRMVGPDRFVLFRGKDLPVADQLASFARAAVVVAPHGAGLANVVACVPNTTLVLFPMRPHVDNTFGHMAAALELDLWIAPDITSYYYGAYGLLTASSSNAVLRAVSVALTEKGLPHKPVTLDEKPFAEWLEENPRFAKPTVEADFSPVTADSDPGLKKQQSKKKKSASSKSRGDDEL